MPKLPTLTGTGTRGRRAWRQWRWGLPVLLLWSLTGCGVQVAYQNVDRLARWFAGDFVTMDANQEARFDVGIADVWAWHRETHLIQYADLLDALAVSWARGTDAEQVEDVVRLVVDWALEIEQRAMPVAIELFASLSNEQVAELREQLARHNTEFVEDEQGRPIDAIRRDWAERTGDRFARLSGRLTAAQRTYLESESIHYLPEAELWSAYQVRWQSDFLKLLVERDDRARLDAGFRQLTAARESYYGTELEQVWASNRRLTVAATTWLINNLTTGQKRRLADRLHSLAEDLRELVLEGGDAPAASPHCEVLVC